MDGMRHGIGIRTCDALFSESPQVLLHVLSEDSVHIDYSVCTYLRFEKASFPFPSKMENKKRPDFDVQYLHNCFRFPVRAPATNASPTALHARVIYDPATSTPYAILQWMNIEYNASSAAKSPPPSAQKQGCIN